MSFLRSLSAKALSFVAAVCLFASFAIQSYAQGTFAPVITVNDRAITAYEIEQRIRFLSLLGEGGDLRDVAEERLIAERLQLEAAADVGIQPTDELINAGIDEFAGRVQLDRNGLFAALEQGGVDPETLRDFIAAGVAWRELVQSRFGPRIRISEDEIEKRAAAVGRAGGIRVLLSEIILPARNPEESSASLARAEEFARITTLGAFADAARRFSGSQSRERGGRIDWLALPNVPAQVRAQVLGLKPGEVTSPIRAENAVAVFQLRAIEEVAPTTTEDLAIDYALYRPEDPSRLASAVTRIDVCDDLYGIAIGEPEERLIRDTVARDKIAPSLALDIARLDDNEFLIRANGSELLMVCGRVQSADAEVDRGQIANQLRNERLTGLADEFLAELTSNARIVRVAE